MVPRLPQQYCKSETGAPRAVWGRWGGAPGGRRKMRVIPRGQGSSSFGSFSLVSPASIPGPTLTPCPASAAPLPYAYARAGSQQCIYECENPMAAGRNAMARTFEASAKSVGAKQRRRRFFFW